MNKLGKFEIQGKLGQGAMGIVYKAYDPFMRRTVALKTITTGLNENPDLVKRFYREAQSAGNLQHPNIVTIFELGAEQDTPFIAMEFLTGEGLDKVIARKPVISLSQKAGFIVQLCRALEYAHKRNPPVVHRDIKPANVMVTADGTVKVVDFGIARIGEGTQSQSSGMLIGTLAYMSPQQFRNNVDARSDIWATGVVFYELLAYRRPFEGDTAPALMSAIMLDKHRAVTELVPDMPADLAAVVDRMLCKELEKRYQSMEEVLIDLEPIWRRLQGGEVSSLIARGQEFFDSRDYEKAKDVAQQVIQIDTSNTMAKSLLEKVNAEIRRGQIVPQLKARVEKGQSLLAAGQFKDARAAAEAALQVDSKFHAAQELLAQVTAAEERAQQIAQALRISQQRLAEGALTEAERKLDELLAMDAGNPIALDLLKQIREQKAKRERQKRLSEILHNARTLWANLQYEECLNVLLAAEKEYPGEQEIARLIETARQDQAEQQRQSWLAQARELASAQKFEESLELLGRVLAQYPDDSTAKTLHAMALQGKQKRAHEERLQENLAGLRALIEQKKYKDVIDRGEKSLKEFPGDFELEELVRFARSEQGQLDQRERLNQRLTEVQRALKEGRFSETVQLAQKALTEFPQNMDLLILSERAKHEQEEKEKQELIKRRMAEVEGRMAREDFVGAARLARETLVAVGPNATISQVLHKAEMEFESREKKKREQNETVVMAQTLLAEGKTFEATVVLKGAVDTQLLSQTDSRIAELFKEVESRKKAAEAAVVVPPIPPKPEAPLSEQPAEKTPPANRPGSDLPAAGQIAHAPVSATIFGGASPSTVVQPVPAVPSGSQQPRRVAVEGAPSTLPAAPAARAAYANPRTLGIVAAVAAVIVIAVVVSLHFAHSRSSVDNAGLDRQQRATNSAANATVPSGTAASATNQTDNALSASTASATDGLRTPPEKTAERPEAAFDALNRPSKPTTGNTQPLNFGSPQKSPAQPNVAANTSNARPTQQAAATAPSIANNLQPNTKSQIGSSPSSAQTTAIASPAPQPQPAPVETPQPPQSQPPPNAVAANIAPISKPVAPAAVTDQTKILRLLDSYVQAYESKDRLQLRHVWPSLSDKQFKDIQGSFKDAQAIHVSLTPGGAPAINGNTATISCIQNAAITAGGQTQQLSYGATFFLEKLGGDSGDWIIDKIEYKRLAR